MLKKNVKKNVKNVQHQDNNFLFFKSVTKKNIASKKKQSRNQTEII